MTTEDTQRMDGRCTGTDDGLNVFSHRQRVRHCDDVKSSKSWRPAGEAKKRKLEKAAQGVAQCEVSATRVVVDAALPRIGKSRLGGHKIANISVNCQRI